MTVLVLSDSHSLISFMRECIEYVKPDAIIHLGDYFDDGETIHSESPGMPFYQVPGNCDKYRCHLSQPDTIKVRIFGVPFLITHGHKHFVKQRLDLLLQDAKKSSVCAVLYGHTHIPNCYCETDGLWVMNPGTCGSYGGSAGIIHIENQKITSCRIIRQEDMEV